MIKIFKFYELFGKSFRFSKAFSRNLKQKPLQLESQQNINKAKNINQKKENEILKSDPQAKKIEELFSPKFDKELDKIIMKKLDEGLTDEAILSELLGKKSNTKKDSTENMNKYAGETIKQYQKVLNESDKEKQRDPSELRAEALLKEMELSEEIFIDSKENSLPELPINQYLDDKRKWTAAEKQSASIKKSINSNLIKREMKNMIEERNKELDLLENGIYPPADIPKLKLQASLTFPEDSKMKQVISKDLEESSKILDLHIKPPKEGDRLIKRTREPLNIDSFEKKKNQIEKWKNTFDFLADEHEFLEEIGKSDIFLEKKRQEELALQKKRLALKESLRNLKKIEDELDIKPQNEDIDYQDLNNKTIKKETDPLMKMYIRGEKSAETMNQQAKTLEIESPFYERHAVRTTRNVSNCLVNIFSYGKQYASNITKGYDLNIVNVLPNNALTVFNVVWDISEDPKNDKKQSNQGNKYEEDRKIIEKNLKKSSKFIAGKVCQQLGLKYAPDLRFFKFQTKDFTNEVADDLKSVIPDVVKEELKEKAAEENKPAIIKKKDLKMLYDKTYDKVIRTMMERPDFNSVIYEEKNKKKFDEFGKKIRNNRDDHGKKKKYRKKDRAAKFWNKN